MDINNQRRSDNFEDRGRGAGGGGLGGGGLARGIPLRGMSIQMIVIIGVLLAIVYFFNPLGLRDVVFGPGSQSAMNGSSSAGSGSTCSSSQSAASACDFSRAILGSTEDVWQQEFSQGRLLSYGGQSAPTSYTPPKLVVFSDAVETGCGNAQSAMGPFYCPQDRNLYVDPSFYDVMAQRLQAPGDFAQAYVIAHEVGHHVQNLIGATNMSVQGDSQNQTSVRVELQADCFAGVWGHTAQATLQIDDADLREALNAAHQIGDDTLQRSGQGYVNPNEFTHGTSAQRMKWFRRGFDSGDPHQCDTFQGSYDQL